MYSNGPSPGQAIRQAQGMGRKSRRPLGGRGSGAKSNSPSPGQAIRHAQGMGRKSRRPLGGRGSGQKATAHPRGRQYAKRKGWAGKALAHWAEGGAGKKQRPIPGAGNTPSARDGPEKSPPTGRLGKADQAHVERNGICDLLHGDALVVAMDQRALFPGQRHGGKPHNGVRDAAEMPRIAACDH